MIPIEKSNKAACVYLWHWHNGMGDLASEETPPSWERRVVRVEEIGKYLFEAELRPINQRCGTITFEIKNPIFPRQDVEFDSKQVFSFLRKISNGDILPDVDGWFKVKLRPRKRYSRIYWTLAD